MNGEAPTPAALAADRRLETPTLQKLHEHFHANERLGRLILNLEIACAFAAAGWLIFREAPAAPGLLPLLAAALAVPAVLSPFILALAERRLRIEDIRPDARFGIHTRASLVALASRVFTRLKLPPRACPIHIIREKDINAYALRGDLLPGLRLHNAVHLNRAILHLLDEPELESVVGHELGHVFPYAPLLTRWYLVHILTVATTAAALATRFPHPAVAVITPLALAWLVRLLINLLHTRVIRVIEFLCDDHGARAAGLLPSLSSEMKIAAETEARTALIHRVLAATANGGTLTYAEAFELYDTAVPFGRADPDATRATIEQLARRRTAEKKRTTLTGYLDYLGGRDDNTEEQHQAIREQLQRHQLLTALPLIPLDRAPYLRGSAHWTPALAAHLVHTLEQNPRALLFHHEDEITDLHTTHPNTTRRILALWRNHHP